MSSQRESLQCIPGAWLGRIDSNSTDRRGREKSDSLSYSISISSDTAKLSQVRHFLESTFTKWGLEEETIHLLVLAVDEVVANRIRHSSKKLDEILVSVQHPEKTVVIEIRDKGEFFDPNNQEKPSISELVNQRRKGGLGLLLVRKIMDKIEVHTEGPLTVHQLYKAL